MVFNLFKKNYALLIVKMYKPPVNSNRVKSIKNKFENIESNSKTSPNRKLGITNNGTRGKANEASNKEKKILLEPSQVKPSLTRQTSDPSKRNIKRTPAFRLEKNSSVGQEDNTCNFQRNTFSNKSALFENKVKQFSALKVNNNNNCDAITPSNSNNIINKTKPLLVKSKSSHDFALIRSRFDRQAKTDQTRIPKSHIFDLYTEPIPKPLRSTRKSDDVDIHLASTLKLTNKVPELTDTLRTALKKPLPSGPAPKKPPRTFQYPPSPQTLNKIDKNPLFLHTPSQEPTKPPKADAKYMLNKLETALRNNKLRSRRKVQQDTTTSGEDSDDSLLFRSKVNRVNMKKPPSPTCHQLSMALSNLNCLPLNCSSNACRHSHSFPYERIPPPEGCSTFFVDHQRTKEPVYAEPFYHLNGDSTHNVSPPGDEQIRTRNIRNSLYYMSSPVLCDNAKMPDSSSDQLKKENEDNRKDLNLTFTNPDKHLNSEETSSLSSFTSDLDLTPSPMEETSSQLIESERTLNGQYQRRGDRVETLKKDLCNALNTSFGSENRPQHVPSESNVTKIINKFQMYLQNVPKYSEPARLHKDTLFYCCFIVERVQNNTQIKFKYPPQAILPDKIDLLCFPESENVILDSSNNCYLVSLTNEKGERTYGYCRRVVPEESARCLPLAYCILSKYKAPRFYQKILREMESRHGLSEKFRNEFIRKFYLQRFPKPGDSIRVTAENDVENVKEEVTLTLHHDKLFENSDLLRLHQLPHDIILKMFSSLLIERKVILVGSEISSLSVCVEAVQGLLYPFTWYHTFIPILPEPLWEALETPTPLLCGVLSKDIVKNYQIQNGIVVDIDQGKVLLEEGDETKILSNNMKKVWLRTLGAISKDDTEYVQYTWLRQAYLQVFRLCFQNLKKHIIDGVFHKEDFIKNTKSSGVKQFLRLFTETAMFSAFINQCINEPEAVMSCGQIQDITEDFESVHKTIEKLVGWKAGVKT